MGDDLHGQQSPINWAGLQGQQSPNFVFNFSCACRDTGSDLQGQQSPIFIY